MFRRIWALTQKEAIQLLRMPLVYLGLSVGPILELILFAVAIHTDIQHIPMVVADQSLSPESEAYVNAFVQSAYFDVVGWVPNEPAAIQTLDEGRASIDLVLPADFAATVEQHTAKSLLLVDGSNSFVTQAALADALAISEDYSAKLLPAGTDPLEVHFQILYNPDLQELWFLVPGMGAFLLYGIALKLTAFGIVREREMGTIEALLVTPIRPLELLVAKTIPNLVLAAADLGLTFAVGMLLFQVPFRGSLLLFAVLAALFAVGSLGLGLAISSISQTQLQANQLASLVNIAVLFVSGFLFPVYGLPWILRIAGWAMPMTYFMTITNGIMIQGVGLSDLWMPVLSLAVLTLAIFLGGARLFRQNLE